MSRSERPNPGNDESAHPTQGTEGRKGAIQAIGESWFESR